MAAPNVLVIGANRGIGLQIVKAIMERGWSVTGTTQPQDRMHSSVDDLRRTGARIAELDYLDEDNIRRVTRFYDQEPLDILVNVGGRAFKTHYQPYGYEIPNCSFARSSSSPEALGPYLAIKHFLPKLERAANPKIINISSGLSFISGNSFGTCMAYRAAKAALYQMSVTMAREWEKEGRKSIIVCVDLNLHSASIPAYTGENDVERCIAFIAGVTNFIDGIGREHSGAILNWVGSRMPV